MTDTDLLQTTRAILAVAPAQWTAFVQDTPTALLTLSAAPGEWSAFQCLCHLLDTESILFPVRLRTFLAGETSFPGFNPDAESTDYSQQSPDEVLQLFLKHRRDNLQRLSEAKPEYLSRQAIHTELGPVTFAQFLNEWAAHDFNHTIQAQRALMQPFIPAPAPGATTSLTTTFLQKRKTRAIRALPTFSLSPKEPMVSILTTPLVENPLRVGLRMRRTPNPCILVLFGITGDLAHRKLLPAIYNLYVERRLPANFSLVGFARRALSDDEMRNDLKASVEKYARNKPSQRPGVWDSFAQGLFYVRSNFDDPEGYKKLANRLTEIDQQRATLGNRLYYLSTPPEFYSMIVQQMGAAGLANTRPISAADIPTPTNGTGPLSNAYLPLPETDTSWRRIVVEKPFGHDLSAAQQLNRQISEVFTEEQIYRIDHYLGKETVQNILVFRFANGIWEPIWSRRYVDSVQIIVAESLGVEDRASYYDNSGALRDMLQNHMMQLLALVAMEPPSSFDAQSVRDEKAKVLRAIKPFHPG